MQPNLFSARLAPLMAAFVLAGLAGLPFAPAPALAAELDNPAAPNAAQAITIPAAMRPNLNIQTVPIVTTQTLPITQGMVMISAAASHQATSQVSAPVDGLIVGNLPQIGQTVTAGQTLFELSSAGLADLQGQRSMAQARAALAQQNLSRDRGLFNSGLIAKKRLDDTQSQAQLAAAELSAMTARLNMAGMKTGGQAIGQPLAMLAPVSGVITQRKIMPGERVMAGQALLEITLSGAQWWLMAVPPSQVPKTGEQAELKIAGCPDAAPVQLVDLTVDSASQLVTLRAEPKTPCAQLRPGQLSQASLWVRQPAALTVVSLAAVTEIDNQPQVFVQRGAQFFLLPVQLRGTFDGMVYLSAEFLPQDLIVTHGMSRLKALALGMGAE